MRLARQFYAETLSIRTSEEYGRLWLHLAGGRDTLVYKQPDATPAVASHPGWKSGTGVGS
jgi:hypothetical protein